jgi:hypothetical protein
MTTITAWRDLEGCWKTSPYCSTALGDQRQVRQAIKRIPKQLAELGNYVPLEALFNAPADSTGLGVEKACVRAQFTNQQREFQDSSLN